MLARHWDTRAYGDANMDLVAVDPSLICMTRLGPSGDLSEPGVSPRSPFKCIGQVDIVPSIGFPSFDSADLRHGS